MHAHFYNIDFRDLAASVILLVHYPLSFFIVERDTRFLKVGCTLICCNIDFRDLAVSMILLVHYFLSFLLLNEMHASFMENARLFLIILTAETMDMNS